MFQNRESAGLLLAQKIKAELKLIPKETIVLGIPRGGVMIAGEVAKALGCLLDVIVVKKIGAPMESELAIGAMGETKGSLYLDKRLMIDLNVSPQYLEEIKKLKILEIKEREKKYRQGKPALDLKGKTVIILDDGAATGATVIAASREVWNNNPKKVMIALPVVAKDTLEKLEKEADEVVYLEAPEVFYAVGQFYEKFPQVGDEEVIKVLSKQ